MGQKWGINLRIRRRILGARVGGRANDEVVIIRGNMEEEFCLTLMIGVVTFVVVIT